MNTKQRIILKELGSNLRPKYLPKRPAEVDEAFCTSTKAERELGFSHITSLEEGIRKTVAWAKKLGYQKPRYLDELEIHSILIPKTWRRKLI